jgi:uncharacterized cupin superfamily protein
MDATVKVAEDRHPWDLEADAGDLELPEPSPRPSNIVNRDDMEGEYGGVVFDLASAAGSERTGLNWVALPPGEEGAPPHCHSLDEEIFIVLDGSGVLELWPTPGAYRLNPDVEKEVHHLRAGHVVSRPAATRIAHYFRAEDETFTLLAYGTRKANDIIYYPRSNKIHFRGVGIIARLESLDYYDGEPQRSEI